MSRNANTLAMALMQPRQDMASQSYNTGGAMRMNMGAIINGQPSLPTPLASLSYVNKGASSNAVIPKMKFPDIMPTRTTVPDIGKNTNTQHINDMADNPAHPAAQLASYLLTNKLTEASMFHRGY